MTTKPEPVRTADLPMDDYVLCDYVTLRQTASTLKGGSAKKEVRVMSSKVCLLDCHVQ